MKNKSIYDIEFNRKIKDMSINNKFSFLKEYLELNKYDFSANIAISEIFDTVFEFFNNRTKWNYLGKAKDKIQRLNLENKMSINEEENEKEEKLYNENIINQTSDSHNFKVH